MDKLEIYLLEGTLGKVPETWGMNHIAKFNYSNVMKSLYLYDFPKAWETDHLKSCVSTIGANDYFNKWTGKEFMTVDDSPLNTLYCLVNKEMANGSRIGGKRTGIPICGGNHQILFYNKKYTNKVPRTMKELIQYSEEARNKHNLEYGFVFPTGGAYFILPFLYGYGADLWSSNKQAISYDALYKTIGMLRELIYDKKVLPVKWEEAESKECFMSSRSAYCIGGDWNIKEFNEASEHNLGVCPIPNLQRECRSTANASYLFLSKYLKPVLYENVEMLCRKMLSRDCQTQLLIQLYRMPAAQNYKLDTSKFDEIMIQSYEIYKNAFILPPLKDVTRMYHVFADLLEPGVLISDTSEKLAEKVMDQLFT